MIRMSKIIRAQIREEIYDSLLSCRLFPEEQKRCHQETRGIGYLLYIDQLIFKESKPKRKNVAMEWID